MWLRWYELALRTSMRRTGRVLLMWWAMSVQEMAQSLALVEDAAGLSRHEGMAQHAMPQPQPLTTGEGVGEARVLLMKAVVGDVAGGWAALVVLMIVL